MTTTACRLAILAALLATTARAQTQTGGFVITLGVDTVHVESFTRTSQRLDGRIVTRSPTTRVMNYSLTFDAGGSPVRYEFVTTRIDGSPIQGVAQAGSVVFGADSVTREIMDKDGRMVTERVVSRPGILPSPSIPYVGTSVLLYEIGFAAARKTAKDDGSSVLSQLYMIPNFKQPGGTPIWFIEKDSVEMDYFGRARRGFKLDAQGRVIRSDWSKTTYAYQMRRVASINVDRIGASWAEADSRGTRMGALSPQDTVRASVNGADIMITYSRPSKRGRVIWGGLVPNDTIWRFGADYATHISTSKDLLLGETPVPAGRYTLWMFPSAKGSMLVVNKQVNIFGTAYNPANDFVRIPLRRDELRVPVERFTIELGDGNLRALWDTTAWSVPLIVR